MLKLRDLHAWYGKSHVLHGVNLQVQAGEIVALLGRNGSGRSTTVKSVMGLVDARGSATWNGQALLGRKPFEIAHLGLGYVPETTAAAVGHEALQRRRSNDPGHEENIAFHEPAPPDRPTPGDAADHRDRQAALIGAREIAADERTSLPFRLPRKACNQGIEGRKREIRRCTQAE